ncbi:hypothetical protein ACLB2K_064352 [Fragaria x ananassa]
MIERAVKGLGFIEKKRVRECECESEREDKARAGIATVRASRHSWLPQASEAVFPSSSSSSSSSSSFSHLIGPDGFTSPQQISLRFGFLDSSRISPNFKGFTNLSYYDFFPHLAFMEFLILRMAESVPIYLSIVAFICTVGAIALAVLHIYRHLMNYTEPTYQRYIVRIIFMVPVSVRIR